MRRTTLSAEQARRMILDTAEKLFLEKGVSRTSLEMISRECGVSRGAVYWHFEDKAQLVKEMIDGILIPLGDVREQLLSDNKGDSLGKLYDLCVACMERVVQPGRERRVMTIIMHRCEFTEELYEVENRRNALIHDSVELVERLFTDKQQRLNSGMTPKAASLQLHSMFSGTLNILLRDPEFFQPILDVRQTFNVYFRSLVKDWP